jgi:hypothetical protein
MASQDGTTCLHDVAALGNLAKVKAVIQAGGSDLIFKKSNASTYLSSSHDANYESTFTDQMT